VAENVAIDDDGGLGTGRLILRKVHGESGNEADLNVPAADLFMRWSATIADIPSYNRIPEGDEGTRTRGQFLEDSAAALIEELKMPSIQIEYSHDFFDQVLKHDVPLTGHAQKLDAFNACIGNADLLWSSTRSKWEPHTG
jgi:hypothetical protein